MPAPTLVAIDDGYTPVIFWITIFAIVLMALVLLREILLPFAIGMALAYLLVPVVNRLERVGVNRALAALTLILVLVVGMRAWSW